MARLKPTERRKSRQSVSSDIRVATEQNIYENTGFMGTEGNGVNGNASHSRYLPSNYELETARCESVNEAIYDSADDGDHQNQTSI